jgi:hypothetical protein
MAALRLEWMSQRRDFRLDVSRVIFCPNVVVSAPKMAVAELNG